MCMMHRGHGSIGLDVVRIAESVVKPPWAAILSELIS